jgi:cytochrome c oxidase subunit II
MMEAFADWFKTRVLRLPMLASEHGQTVDDMLVYVHWLMFGLFLGWMVYLLFVLVRFHHSRQPRAYAAGPRTHFTSWLEGGVVLVEAVLLIGFSIPLWAKMVTNPPEDAEATVIRVMGRQFNWVAHYAGEDGVMGRQDPALSSASDPFGLDRMNDPAAMDDVVVQGTIVVPVDRPVAIHLTALDVIHSFAVPAMRITQDAIPGLSIPFWFTPVNTGEYKIVCAQLCGSSHYGMFGVLKVVTLEEYEAWLSEQSQRARAAVEPPVSYE